jgi:hypothetical protein
MVSKDQFKIVMDELTARDDWTGEVSYDKYVEILKLLET